MNPLEKRRLEGILNPKNKHKDYAIFDDANGSKSWVNSAEDDVAAAEVARLRIDVASAISAFAETDINDLDNDETLSDRFDALMIGICDADKNGDLDDDELDLLGYAYELAQDNLLERGLSGDDVDAMLNDGDASAAANIHEFLVNSMPEGEDAEMDAINNFAFDSDSDAAVMDATYKRNISIRNGKKTIIRKRIAGTVRLSAKQKAAIKKAQRKAHSGAARIKRLKSLKKRLSMGLNKK